MTEKLPHNSLVVSLYVSEGRSPERIEAIAKALQQVKSCRLICVSPNRYHHRTNFIFGGEPKSLLKAVFAIAAKVYGTLDLSEYDEQLAYMGALDLISFIPLHPEQDALAVEMSETCAATLATTYGIPAYLFGLSAKRESRADFRLFRQYSHLNLPDLLESPDWRPDYGPAQYNERSGAVVVGARTFHVNFAIFFDTEDIEIIDELSKVHQRIIPANRQSGGESGHTFNEIVSLLQQVSTFVDDRPDKKVVRLLCNVPDYRRTNLEDLAQVFRNEAAELGIETVGSRVLGYLPYEALVGVAGLAKQTTPGREEARKVIQKLKLDAIEPFNMDRQILDFYMMPGIVGR